MESPKTSNSKITEDDASSVKINCTPKTHKHIKSSNEFSLYHVPKESSPSFRAGQDVLEVGWGDSPEPLIMEKNFELNKTPVTCKKKLEPKESPKSSIPFKRRNVRSTFTLPSKSVVDVAKYVAEVQELSKKIMKEFNAQKSDKDIKDENKNCTTTQSIDKNLNSCTLQPTQELDNSKEEFSDCSSRNEDSAFDSVLQSFINEEDDWLSQALNSQELAKTPHKGNFVKSKSENELSYPQLVNLEKKSLTQNCRNINNNFRRTSSFDMSKNQNNSNCLISTNETLKTNNILNGRTTQYSLQDIERKRLEAKYRKERKEIERKKLEALKKLEMKKLRPIKT